MTDRRPLRAGLCGLGEIGQLHLEAINDSPDADLVAVCDLDLGRAERSAIGAAGIYSEISRMLFEKDLDVVDICLPHHLHRPVAVEALEADCDVILEKPLATDLEGADAIVEAAGRSGRKVGISYNQVFYEPHRRLAEVLERGRLGKIQSLYERLWMGGKYGGWREDANQVGGGLLMDAGVHRVYMASFLAGPVVAVTAVMDVPRSEDSFFVGLEFESGASGVLQGSYHGPEGVFDDRIEVQASEGMAEVHGCEAFFEGDLRGDVQMRIRVDGEWSEESVTDSWDESVRRSVAAILASFAEGEEPEIGLSEGRETVAIIEAAYRSAEQGRRISLSELDQRDQP